MKLWQKIGFGVLATFVLIQLVPAGREHVNPPLVMEPQWDKHETRELFMRACGDCHSHNTEWPWYANIAPVSWMVHHHVNHGREYLNVSDWERAEKQHADESEEMIRSGEMPMPIYLPTHPEAKLSDEEKEALIAGLKATFARKASTPEPEAAPAETQEAAETSETGQ